MDPHPPRQLRLLSWPVDTHGGNPYIDQLVESVRAEGVEVRGFSKAHLASGRWDVCHMHWPEWTFAGVSGARAMWRVTTMLLALALGRARGTRLCWTVHNATPHEVGTSAAERLFWWAFGRLVSGTVRLSAASGQEIEAQHPAVRLKPSRVIPHGPYDAVYPRPPAADVGRREWGVESGERVIAFFGQLRRYKGVDVLLETFGQIPDAGARLIVAGAPMEPDVGCDVEERAARDPRVVTRLQRIDPPEVAALAAASDLFVLPYRKVLNSGAAILALSLGVPVLVPATATFDELADLVGQDWVVRYGGELEVADLQRAFAAVAGMSARSPDLSRLAWPLVGRETARFYGDLCGIGPAP